MKRASGRRRRPGQYLFALAVLAVFAFAAWWAVARLFPVELRQTGDWLHAKYEALRH
jgi:hypothetical protein